MEHSKGNVGTFRKVVCWFTIFQDQSDCGDEEMDVAVKVNLAAEGMECGGDEW